MNCTKCIQLFPVQEFRTDRALLSLCLLTRAGTRCIFFQNLAVPNGKELVAISDGATFYAL